MLTRRRWATIKLDKKSLRLLIIFKKYGVVNSSMLICGKKKIVKISPFIYKGSPFFKGVKLISTPSKIFTIKLSTLNIINRSLGNTILLLETSKGIITHSDALKLRIGGKILCVVG